MDDIQKTIDRENKIKKYDGEYRIESNYHVLDHLHEQKTNEVENKLKSLIPRLDFFIDGFFGGELTVISGQTKNGKTLFAQTLTEAFARQEKKSLWFTFEVPAWQFLHQFSDPMPYFLMPMKLKGNSLEWLYERIYEAKLKYGLDAVFVDHLHFLADMSRVNNVSLEIGQVMRRIKLIALEFNICFFLMAHTNKVKPDADLDNDSLRDSSFVAQEADNVFFIKRSPKDGDNDAALKITANRRNGVMGKTIYLVKHGKYLKEEDRQHDE